MSDGSRQRRRPTPQLIRNAQDFSVSAPRLNSLYYPYPVSCGPKSKKKEASNILGTFSNANLKLIEPIKLLSIFMWAMKATSVQSFFFLHNIDTRGRNSRSLSLSDCSATAAAAVTNFCYGSCCPATERGGKQDECWLGSEGECQLLCIQLIHSNMR